MLPSTQPPFTMEVNPSSRHLAKADGGSTGAGPVRLVPAALLHPNLSVDYERPVERRLLAAPRSRCI